VKHETEIERVLAQPPPVVGPGQLSLSEGGTMQEAETKEARDQEDIVVAAREVMEFKSARVVKGVLLDLQTAQVIVKVADALSPERAKILAGMPLTAAANICWKLVR
jgi:hypothetical protein